MIHEARYGIGTGGVSVLGYSSEVAVQMLIRLLKENNINKVIISPGSTNLTFVASLQFDSFFKLYSCPDERSAAYMACGMAVESHSPVVVTCTGATASREYLSGLTEAFHRNIPILAVTATQSIVNADNLTPQFIDRTVIPKDVVRFSAHIQVIRGKTDEWDCMLKINRAIQHLFKNGGGPVHINLTTSYSSDYSVNELPWFRNIKRYELENAFPKIDRKYQKIAISCGCKWNWSERLTKAIDAFCERYGAVVFVDHTSGYKGRYGIQPTLLTSQEEYEDELLQPDLLIHIGEYSGDYYTYLRLMNCKEVWRVSIDGYIRDTFHSLSKIFEMKEEYFFEKAVAECVDPIDNNYYYKRLKKRQDEIYDNIPLLPFSNIYIAKTMACRIPKGSEIHFGLSNSLRAWTFFDIDNSVDCYANVGCRGIDGVLSTTVGASLVNQEKTFFVVLGDLAFFYDFNVLGNRHIRGNIRILLINNGGGVTFHLYQHSGKQVLENDVGEYVAADRHYGNKSSDLVRHYATDLGFEYLSAHDKCSFLAVVDRFLTTENSNKPMLFEIFTNQEAENEALKLIRNIARGNDIV